MLYVIYSKDVNGYYTGDWPYQFDGNIENARLYKSEHNALQIAEPLFEYHVYVIPVQIEHKDLVGTGVQSIIDNKIEEYLPIVTRIDKMDAVEVEEIPNKEWDEYKRMRRYLRVYCDRYKG